MEKEKRNKIKSLLLGSAVGDVLGVPYEFMARGYFKCEDMTGYGTHSQPEGTWSDDTSMTLCLAETIAEGFDLQLLADKFVEWGKYGKYTAHGNVFDMGGATRRAILNIIDGKNPTECGGTTVRDNGNGSLMRIAPLVFYSTKFEDVADVSSITHAHEISVNACFIYIKFLDYLLNGVWKQEAYRIITSETYKDFKNSFLETNLAELPESSIKSSGYVVDTLRASLWCFLTTDNYKDAVLKAVNLGDDTDTTAAVTGAIAGLYYGLDSIPKEWLDKLVKRKEIEDIADRMAEKV